MKFPRRHVLTGGVAAAAALTVGPALLPIFHANAAPLKYTLKPVKVAEGVWVVEGAQEAITRQNGGAIANIGIVDTTDGAVVIDTGPSKRYGEALVALAKDLTGKPVVRAFLTHFHPDHVFGNQAFGPGVVASSEGVISGLQRMGEDFSSAMYYIAGDWMRGTEVILPATTVSDGVETIGNHRFKSVVLRGHTDTDLVIHEETTGVVFAGDLVFLDRAPTTPHAELPAWRASLKTLTEMSRDGIVVPGHGPAHRGAGRSAQSGQSDGGVVDGRGVSQTLAWLETIEMQIRDCFDRGLSATEAIAEPLPAWTDKIALSAYEYERSVLHFYPELEAGGWPRVDTERG